MTMLQRGRYILSTLPTFTTQSTVGVFTLADVQALKLAGTYPRGPIAPTGLIVTGSSTQASLSWTAPAITYGTITNYLVEYTASGGSPQYVLTGSTSTSYTLTGLTNDVSYTIRVAAVNHTTGDWSSSLSVTPAAGTLVDYLVIGGGGGGGGVISGGGGAGGYRASILNTDKLLLLPDVTYVVTVGGGGAGGGGANFRGQNRINGANGSNSVFSSVTSAGGGGGAVNGVNGVSGGSGGGAGGRYAWQAGSNSGGSGNTPSTSPSQGNNGGNSVSFSGGGGGGGAGSAGGAGTAPDVRGGDGGAGAASSITGSSVTRAAGGGGGSQYSSPGAGGSGGGGNGAGFGGNGASGTANTGSGGGGAGEWPQYEARYGGNGGAGVVIIRSPQPAFFHTGSPVVTTVGSDTVYQFNSTGSIRFTQASFSQFAVVLTTASGSGCIVPAGATSMKVWAIGGGGTFSDYCDGGGGNPGGHGAIAVRTYSVSGGQNVSFSIGAGRAYWVPSPGYTCDAWNIYAGSTTVTYGGVSVVAGGGRTHRDGPPINGTCTNATTCGVAGNDVDGLNAAVTLAGGSISGRGIAGSLGNAGGNGAIVLYFT